MELCCCWALVVAVRTMNTSEAEKKQEQRKSNVVRQLLILFFLWELSGVILWFMSPHASDSLLPAPALKPQRPWPLIGRANCGHPCGQTLCTVCASSASVLSVFHAPEKNGEKTTEVPRLSQLTNSSSAFTNQQEKVQGQVCSTDNRVNQWSCFPSPPHTLSTSMDVLFWYWITSLSNYIVYIRSQ